MHRQGMRNMILILVFTIAPPLPERFPYNCNNVDNGCTISSGCQLGGVGRMIRRIFPDLILSLPIGLPSIQSVYTWSSTGRMQRLITTRPQWRVDGFGSGQWIRHVVARNLFDMTLTFTFIYHTVVTKRWS